MKSNADLMMRNITWRAKDDGSDDCGDLNGTVTTSLRKPTVCARLIITPLISALEYEGCSIPPGMSSETLTRKRRDEVYNGLKASLEILASAVKMSPVPGLEGIIGTVTSIMNIVEVGCYLPPR